MENKRDPNSFRTKLLIIISKELEHEKKCLMKLNSKDINDINTHFSINSFEVFMENPIEYGLSNNLIKNFENNVFQRNNFHKQKISSSLNHLYLAQIKKDFSKTKNKKKEIIFVKKKL